MMAAPQTRSAPREPPTIPAIVPPEILPEDEDDGLVGGGAITVTVEASEVAAVEL